MSTNTMMPEYEKIVREKNNRILVIDDNEQIHDDFKKILGCDESSECLDSSKMGLFGCGSVADTALTFEVDSAQQGEEGYEMACRAAQDNRPYAMAFVDVRMPPGWDGIKTIKEIWKNDPKLQVVICTAYSDYSWADMLQEFGASDQLLILKKPFDNVEVRQLACALTKKWHLGRQAEMQLNVLECMVEQRTASLRKTNGQLVREIEERTQAEEEVQKKDEQLRQAQKMELIGSLAGGVAHEFNNLLQVISGYTRYAMDEMDSESDSYQDLDEVLKAAEKASTLTGQLLGFSRRQALKPIYLEPTDLLRDVEKFLQPVIGRNVDLEVFPGEELGTIYGDAMQLTQVLLNLCLNARDAMPSGGRVTVKSEREMLPERRGNGCKPELDLNPGAYIVISVTDTGSGMTPEVLEQIFEPFFTTKDVGKGTGLGLSMVYGIVKQHDGTVRVESQPGKGTTFQVYLPVKEPEACDQPVVESGESDALCGSEVILVTEDEFAVRNLIVRTLQKAGYTVHAAVDAEQAVSLFEQHAESIALLVSDVKMPGASGRELYEHIRATKPDVRVVFCTGYDSASSETSFVEESGMRLIEKPFNRDRLLQVVRECLDAPADVVSEELCASLAL